MLTARIDPHDPNIPPCELRRQQRDEMISGRFRGSVAHHIDIRCVVQACDGTVRVRWVSIRSKWRKDRSKTGERTWSRLQPHIRYPCLCSRHRELALRLRLTSQGERLKGNNVPWYSLREILELELLFQEKFRRGEKNHKPAS